MLGEMLLSSAINLMRDPYKEGSLKWNIMEDGINGNKSARILRHARGLLAVAVQS